MFCTHVMLAKYFHARNVDDADARRAGSLGEFGPCHKNGGHDGSQGSHRDS